MNSIRPPRINPGKPIAWLNASNAYPINRVLGGTHVMTGDIDACKRALKGIKRWKSVPKPMRRGAIAQALARHRENRITYLYVMACQDLTPMAKQAWAAYHALAR